MLAGTPMVDINQRGEKGLTRDKVAESLDIGTSKWRELKAVGSKLIEEEKFPDVAEKLDSKEYTIHGAFVEINYPSRRIIKAS